ncbi:MAG: hypothetical protein B7X47_09500 [Ferrovum sp. 34-44-207]|nr:MAG: hypothetical protein B7X47_09500 [Ferrovum sp. 34-44-207]
MKGSLRYISDVGIFVIILRDFFFQLFFKRQLCSLRYQQKMHMRVVGIGMNKPQCFLVAMWMAC